MKHFRLTRAPKYRQINPGRASRMDRRSSFSLSRLPKTAGAPPLGDDPVRAREACDLMALLAFTRCSVQLPRRWKESAKVTISIAPQVPNRRPSLLRWRSSGESEDARPMTACILMSITDSPQHVIALCPNFHRRVHHGFDRAEYNQELADAMKTLEPN